MQRLIILLFISLTSYFVSAQQTYFSERYNFIGWEVIFSILELDSTYLCVAGADSGSSGVLLNFINKEGNLLTQKFYSELGNILYAGGPGSLIKTGDGGFALAGSDLEYVMLWKFDQNGDTLWTRRYGDTSYFQSAKQCKQTLDGGYVIIGQTATYDIDGDFWLIKTDSMGNIEWDTTYGGVEYEFGISVDVCVDGGYVLAGTTRSYGQDIGSTSDIYVIKVDSVGAEEWSGVYGGPYGEAIWNVQAMSDGGYVVAGGLVDNAPGGFPYSKPYLIKIDAAGNTVWEKTYGPVRFQTTLRMARELPDGSIIACGHTTDSIGFHGEGLVLKVSGQGDSIWFRTPEIISGSSSENFLYDIQHTIDNGFISAGWLVPSSPDTGGQDMWVLKMDSMGCEVENCFVGVEEFEMPDVEMIIYPNPFNFEATVLFDKLNIDAQLTIYDVTGRLVGGYTISKNQKSLTLTAKEIGTGIFFLRLGNEHLTLNSQKVIIAR